MPRPRLLHPVWVVIQPLDRTATAFRANAREAIKTVERSATARVQGQVQWTKQKAPTPTRAGIEENASGYILFRKTDLANLDFVPNHGDRITAIGSLTGLSLYMTVQVPAGHYDGEHWLTRIDFTDKAPAR